MGSPSGTPSSRKANVLFLCVQNAARSQMAEALLKKLANQYFGVQSAGTNPAKEVHPLAIKAMANLGLDISGCRPRDCRDPHFPDFDYAITLCEDDPAECPAVTTQTIRARWIIPDPIAFHGRHEEQEILFRQAALGIKRRLESFITLYKQPAWRALPRERQENDLAAIDRDISLGREEVRSVREREPGVSSEPSIPFRLRIRAYTRFWIESLKHPLSRFTIIVDTENRTVDVRRDTNGNASQKTD